MWMDDMMNNYDDVWVVPIRAGIEYMKDPAAKDDLDFFEPFGCADLPDFTCFSPRNCRSDIESSPAQKYCCERAVAYSFCHV